MSFVKLVDIRKYSYHGVLAEYHNAIVLELQKWNSVPKSKLSFLLYLSSKLELDEVFVPVIDKHLEYYYSFLYYSASFIYPVLYYCKFSIQINIPISFLTPLSNSADPGIFEILISHESFSNRKHNTQQKLIGFYLQLAEKGYVNCKAVFVQYYAKNETSNKKQKNESTRRYCFNDIGDWFKFKDHPKYLKKFSLLKSNLENEDYIVLMDVNNEFIQNEHNCIFVSKSEQDDVKVQVINNITNNELSPKRKRLEIDQEQEEVIYDDNNPIYNKDVMELQQLFSNCLSNNKLIPNTFFFEYLKDCFQYMNCDDSRGMRWSPQILCYAQDLLSAMGYNSYEAIGRGAIGKEKFQTDSSNFNLVLPCSSTLDNHFHIPNYGYGDTAMDETEFEIFKSSMDLNDTTIGILQVDAMDLSGALSVNTRAGMLIGAIQGPIPISQANMITEEQVNNNFLAEKVLQTLYLDIEGRVRISGNFKFCKSETAELIEALIQRFKEIYTSNISCTVSDAGSANWKYFTNLANKILHHFCYSHLSKNMRNAIDSKPKLFPIQYQRKSQEIMFLHKTCLTFTTNQGCCHLFRIQFKKPNDNIIHISVIIDSKVIDIKWNSRSNTTVSNNGVLSSYFSVNESTNTLSFTLISETLEKSIPSLVINNNSNTDIIITSIEESLLQKFELATLDEIYQSNPSYWSKIIKRSAFIRYDVQSESVLREVCSPKLITELRLLNERSNNQYHGLYIYLKLIHDIFHVYDDVDVKTGKSVHNLTQVEHVLKQSLATLEHWDFIFYDINNSNKNNNFTIFGTLTKKTIAHNLTTIQKLLTLVPANVSPSLHVFGTRSLEGYFGEQRVHSPRTTALEYIYRYTTLKYKSFKDQCVILSYNNTKLRKYMDKVSQSKTIDAEEFMKFMKSIEKKSELTKQPFSEQDLKAACELQLLCVKYRANTIRQTFHQLKYDSMLDSISFGDTTNTLITPTTLSNFQISYSGPLATTNTNLFKLHNVRSTFIMKNDSLIHKENRLPTFLLKTEIELDIFNLPFRHDQLPSITVSIQNSSKNGNTTYLENNLSFDFKYVANGFYKLIVKINSTTSLKNYLKNIIVTIDNMFFESPPFYLYARSTKSLCKYGDVIPTTFSSQNTQ